MFLLYLLIAGILFLVLPCSGQTDLLKEAKSYSYAGRYKEADSLFSTILSREPDNTEAMLGSAYNHSWHNNTDQARLEFVKILKKDIQNRSALIGLGYTLAWSGDYANAKHPFLNALKLYPHDSEIEKGLAYVYLWQGSPDVAMDMFEKLRDKEPSNPEYYVAMAYAHLQKYETIKARRLVDHAISLDPQNKAANEVRTALGYATPFVEADIWGGYSQMGADSRFGLRAVQLSTQLTKSFRALLSYDNAMSMDNLFFLDHKLQAESYMAGGIMSWNKSNTTRLQIGYRDLHQNGSQWLMVGEQAYVFNDRKVIKAGGLYLTGDPLPSEWMLYAGISIPVQKRFRVEPMYYINHRELASSLEHKVALHTQWFSRQGFELGAGANYGMVNAAGETGTASTFGAYLSALVPIHRMIWFQANLRHEKSLSGTFRVAAAGIKLRFEK